MRNNKMAFMLAAAMGFGGIQVATAADMAVKARPMVAAAPAAISWTGCYIGGNAGAGWFHKDNTDKFANPSISLGSHDGSGFVGGGQIGCDYQVNQFVFGIRGMFDWASLTGQNTIPTNATVAYNTKLSSYGSLTGRVGYTVVPAVLLYVQGGGAWVRDAHQQLAPQPVVANAETSTRTGWTVGGGLEYMVVPHWSVFAEYNYADFGTKNSCFVVGSCPGLGVGNPGGIDQKLNVSTALVGVNWRF